MLKTRGAEIGKRAVVVPAFCAIAEVEADMAIPMMTKDNTGLVAVDMKWALVSESRDITCRSAAITTVPTCC